MSSTSATSIARPTCLTLSRGSNLKVALFTLPVGSDVGGEPGVAALPGRQAEFRNGVDAEFAYAPVLGTRKDQLPSGSTRPVPGLELAVRGSCREPRLGGSSFRWERDPAALPVRNRVENPCLLPTDLTLAQAILDDVGSPNLWLQFDMYPVQRTQGDVVAAWRRLSGRPGPAQIPGSAARGEPGTGELDYRCILGALDRPGREAALGWNSPSTGRPLRASRRCSTTDGGSMPEPPP